MSGSGRGATLDEHWRNGEWYPDAWFRKQRDGIEARRGRGHYSPELLQELATVLLEIFPPHVCREQLARPSGGAHLAGLFFHMWGHLVPLLEIAELVSCARPVPERLRARLAVGEEVIGAQLELELLAAARLAQIQVDHEPLGNAGPDLRLIFDHREYFVEAKLLEGSEVVGRARAIERDLADLLVENVTDRAVSIKLDTGGGALLLLDRRGRALIDEVGDRVREECHKFIASGFRPIEIELDGIGRVHIGAPQGNWASVDLFELEVDDYDNERAIRLVRDAARQLPARGRRLILVSMARDADVDDAARLYHARAATRGPHYTNVDAVVFVRGDTGIARIVATPGEHLTQGDQDLARVLSQPMPPPMRRRVVLL